MTASPERRAIIVGSGIAGLSAALHLGDCTVITKSFLGAGSTRLAQGGLAVALGPDDSVEQHVEDTLRVSAGLGDRHVAQHVVSGAIEGVEWLADIGATFDMHDDRLQLGREAGHSLHRIVHANGDATGAEVVRALTRAVAERPDIEVLENTFAIDAIVQNDRVVGLITIDANGASALVAQAVVLATGGIGSVYSATTNPAGATGDGLALAWRAGAQIRDCEFVQFHPTALANGRDPLPLLTEALRGAGGRLVNGRGERFMTGIHDDAELAPRDVVARAIWSQLRIDSVFLDVRHIPAVADRFPTAAASASAVGLDIVEDLLPVTPAQHYFMGGVVVDESGRSTVPGLYAAGEVTSSGLHGANRLASNSLIEGLVFGRSISESIRNDDLRRSHDFAPSARSYDFAPSARSHDFAPSAPMPEAVAELRELMWLHGGIMRAGDGLRTARDEIVRLRPALAVHPESDNLAVVAALIVDAALARRESRGAHQRVDYPALDPMLDRSIVSALRPSDPAMAD
ncbi:MAG: L-aspartate oxidase [Acidimicrobiia bacterium]|nr:L-aspartate oxidase [Acidimicrobiia bacterium]